MIAMMLPLGAVIASASTASTPTYAADTVALVNGTEVNADGFQAALTAATSGGTVEIVKDFTIASLTFGNLNVATSTWTINGNDHTITSTATAPDTNNYLVYFSSAYAEVNDLTLVTKANGIRIKDASNLTFNDVNVYSGGTKSNETISEYDTAKCSYALYVSNNARCNLVVNGGEYKAYGTNGYVLYVGSGNVVVNSGNFVGEDCTFVARVLNSSLQTKLVDATASLTVYSGTFIKPVVNRKAATDGAVIRADQGGIVNIHGGDFASFSGRSTGSNNHRDFVFLAGISSSKPNCVGFFNIFGGNFYSFMADDMTSGSTQLIGNFSGSSSAMNDTELTKINTNIYGGNFYTTLPSREDNLMSVVNKAAATIQHVPADQYTATTVENQTVTVYGKEFTGVTKYTINYVQPTTAPENASVMVTNSDGRVYYLTDYIRKNEAETVTIEVPAITLALNGVADKDSTVKLLKDVSIKAIVILNRHQKMTLDGNDKTINCTTSGMTVWSGEITIKNATIVSAGAYAIRPTSKSTPLDAIDLKLRIENCTLSSSAEATTLTVNPFLKGSMTVVNTTIAGKVINMSIIDPDCAHVWGDGVDSATHTAPGTLTYTCSACNSTKSEPSAAKGHSYGNWIKVDDDQHKKVCDCSSDADVFENHTWDAGVETTPATHTTKGVKTYTCTATGCGATKTEDIEKTTEHAHGDWTKVDDAKHSKTCACGDVITADHAWNDGEVTTAATTEADGVKTYTCADCGATKTEAIAKLDAPAADAPATDAPATDAPAEEKGCKNSIGVGAVAVLAVAGLACGIVSKKRED